MMTSALTSGSKGRSTTKPRTRVNWTAAERAQWLRMFKEGGQTVAEFCRANDLRPATLSAWRRQPADTDVEDAGLVEIAMSALPATAPGRGTEVSMQLPNGAKLQIVPGTDPTWLSALVTMLMSAGV